LLFGEVRSARKITLLRNTQTSSAQKLHRPKTPPLFGLNGNAAVYDGAYAAITAGTGLINVMPDRPQMGASQKNTQNGL